MFNLTKLEHTVRFEIFTHLLILILVTNVLLNHLQSPDTLFTWMTEIASGQGTVIDFTPGQGFTESLPFISLFIFATLCLWLIRKRVYMYIPLVIYLIWSTILMVIAVIIVSANLWNPHSGASVLLPDAILTWISNILIFSVWYWMIDHQRQHQKVREEREMRTDLVFPQVSEHMAAWRGWVPKSLDYLFVSFVVSAQFGPSDVYFVTKRAKALVMLQSIVALIITITIAARAISLIG